MSFLYTFEILKWGKRVTFKKWKFGQKFQRHFIRPKSMGLQHIASTLSTRAYILIPELLVIKIFLRNIRVKKWCNELNFERSSSRVLNRNESYFAIIIIIHTVDVWSPSVCHNFNRWWWIDFVRFCISSIYSSDYNVYNLFLCE